MVKKILRQEIKKAVKKLFQKEIDFDVFAGDKFGDYASNAAMVLKTGNSVEAAKKITEELKKSKKFSQFVGKIEIANPGFLNFWLTDEILREELKEILKRKQNYGRLRIENRKLKAVQVEFISANPTGPLTLANGRGGFMGDVLANILEFQGWKIEREYYVNDTGNQILTLGKSILAANNLIKEDENFYKGGYVKEWAKKHKAISGKYRNNPLKLGQSAAADFLKEIKSVVKKAKINFNRWTSENRHIHKKSFIAKALKIFKKKKLVYEKDGALWLKTSDFGDEKDRVLITQDGFPTYFLADAGHFLETKSRGFNSKIMILGPDHYGYVRRAAAAAKIMGIENFEAIITQAMRLMSKGQEIKMSKRSGEFITFGELIKETGADAARFFFLMHSAQTHMDFDLDLAKERSMKNPVYYVQYAAVRAQSILRKSKTQNPKSKINLNLLNTPPDMNLMRQLARFPEAVGEAGQKRQPQILARYALEFSREFHNFYEKERIIGEKPEIMAARSALIQATLIIFKNLFALLEIDLPKKM
ncbi:MAG: arginine--tRNA ligase [Candidatus Niyogibacteria bacterium]|nr:arginine--tRNA ligase [Candidatus Niyogibacteria bacterium]